MPSSSAAVPTSPASRNTTSATLDSNLRRSTRRRQVVVAEKTTSVQVQDEEVPAASDDKDATSGKDTTSGKDLSNAVREDSVLERPRDLSQIKKGIIASGVTPRRRKPAKPEKPVWQTVISVTLKNALLLAALIWLVQSIWRWNERLIPTSDGQYAVLEVESRIAEVETSLKKTAKMAQVQLDVLDKRTKQAEEKGDALEKELKMLASRTHDMDKFLSELRDANFLSKEEFEAFAKELEESKKLNGNSKGLSLDDVGSYAREIVLKEVEKHAADGLGRVDYALASGGARVVRHSEPYTSGKAGNWFPVAKSRGGVHGSAHKMLEPSFGEPGQCFPLKGTSGFVEIKLRGPVTPDAITLEHVAKSVAYDRSSAPKDCQVSGWFEGPEDDPSSRGEKRVILKEFTYDLEKSNAQTFNIDTVYPDAVNMIRLDFSSNHGSPSHTCIYRLRVHGHE